MDTKLKWLILGTLALLLAALWCAAIVVGMLDGSAGPLEVGAGVVVTVGVGGAWARWGPGE